MNQHRCYGCMEMITEEVCPHCGYSLHQNNEPNQLPVGTLLREQYLIGKVLGQGGFGITYMGWDTYLDEPVAIKEFYPSTAVNRDSALSQNVRVNVSSAEKFYTNSRERFLREAKTLAKLRNIPEIVGIMGFFPANNTAYIIMDYVKGIDLRHYVRQRGGRLTAAELLPILEPIARALDTVHQAGLVHRDISPDNIMIRPDGTPKLLDFGAVRDSGSDDADIDLSHSTEAILKHGFAPVEQYRARGNLGPWTDEYGFCASIYYCLTGQVPPDALTRMTDDIHPDWDSIPGLTPQQRFALEKGMSIRAKDRFGSMKALYDALYGGQAAQDYAPTTSVHPKEPVTAPVTPVSVPVSSRPAPKPEPKKKKKRDFVTPFLCLVAIGLICLGFYKTQHPDADLFEDLPVPGFVAEVFESTPAEPWVANVLAADPLDLLPIPRTQVLSVTFLDTLADAPADAVDVSRDGSGTVLAWGSNSSGYTFVSGANDLIIAAEGGINGQYACAGLFEDCSYLRSVTFGTAFHTEKATSMDRMFAHCQMLGTVDAENLNTGNVTSMRDMFNMYVKNTDASGNVTYTMPYLVVLKSLDVSNWDVSKVTDMYGLFCCCTELQTLDISRWDVSRVTNMSDMFYSCEKLTDLDVGAWDVSSVEDMSGMFCWCTSLKKLDVSHWDVSNVKYMGCMFANCLLQELDVSQWDVSNVVSMWSMFHNFTWMLDPAVGNWDVSNVEDYEDFMGYGRTINGLPWKDFFEK